MQFGVCAALDKADIIAGAGYDYIELSVAGDLVPDEDGMAWSAKRAAILAMPLPVHAFNSFVRRGRITGDNVDFPSLRRYVETALRRAQEVGGETIVFGSGGARRVPDGFNPAIAAKQIRDFLQMCAEISERSGVTIAIEPLNTKECNILTSVAKAAAFALPLNHKGVQILADTYHMEAENEPLQNIVEFAEIIAHVHTADTDRRTPGTGTYSHQALFAALKEANYDSRLSIECNWEDLAAQAAPALAHLKAAYQAV